MSPRAQLGTVEGGGRDARSRYSSYGCAGFGIRFRESTLKYGIFSPLTESLSNRLSYVPVT